MVDVCKKMQKLLDYSNFKTFHGYIKEYEKYRLQTWNDEVLLWDDITVKHHIKNNNEMVSHLRKCKHEGCKKLLKTWNDSKDTKAKIIKKRGEFLNDWQNQQLVLKEETIDEF